MKRKSAAVRRGNIEQIVGYNPFPKTGVVKEAESDIRDEVAAYHRLYSHLSYDDLLFEAVRLAHRAAELFKPDRGAKFSTFVRHHLKVLHRFAQNELEQLPEPPSYYSAERREAAEIGEEPEPPRPFTFRGGGNGARISIDKQWISGIQGSFIRFQRHRIRFGVQLTSSDEDHARDVAQRISDGLPALLANKPPESAR